ncbi:MAG: hypothetical protein V4615_06790 [Bacteroidota bacterium]
MPIVKCSRNYYKRLKVDQLDNFAGEVEEGVYVNNPLLFPLPPLNQAAFHLLITTYDTTRAAYTGGGSLQKGAFDNAKAALLAGLDELADYVDEVANGLAATITDAGFAATKGTRSSAVKPAQPMNIFLKRGIALQLIAECPKITGVNSCLCIITQGAPLPVEIGITADGKLVLPNFGIGPGPVIAVIGFDFSEQRVKVFSNLTHDATYYVYFVYVNAAGVSPLSEPVSIVCW